MSNFLSVFNHPIIHGESVHNNALFILSFNCTFTNWRDLTPINNAINSNLDTVIPFNRARRDIANIRSTLASALLV